MTAGESANVSTPTGVTPNASDLVKARIRLNEWRLVGMSSGFLVAILTTAMGWAFPPLAQVGALGFIGLPVAVVGGWIFAPMVVVAPWRWLPPVVVGIGIAAAFLGWVGISMMVVIGGLILAPLSGGVSLFASLAISAAGVAAIAPTVVITIPVAAVWAAVVRGLAFWRWRTRRI